MRNSLTPIALALFLTTAASAAGLDVAPYLWEKPATTDVQLPADRAWLVTDLRTEIDKVLAAGHLAPYYFNAGDLHHEGYFLYVAPGRIITTLAYAYPHLTADQQAKAKSYVAKELDNPKYAPWAGAKLPPIEGAGREGFPAPKGFNFDRWWGMEGQHRPCLHTLYGLWLWADRAGDWATVERHWPQIKAYYVAHAKDVTLYGELGAHVAIVRLAHHFGDSQTESLAVDFARRAFDAALDYDATEQSSFKSFNRLKETHHNVLASTNFMLMNTCPEVGRFLADHLKEPVLKKNQAIKSHYPDWWLIAPPYASWAGNIGPDCEAQVLPREVFGMVFPVERWVAQAPPGQLANYMASGPDGIGDCYWLDSLAWTIESFGRTRWVDCRAAR